MKIKGAIFDMDGTLINSLILWDVIWDEFGNRYLNGKKFRPTDKEDKAVRTMTLKAAMDYIHDIYKMGANADELLSTANELIESFYSNKVELKDGVIDFLEHCRNNGMKMCIASATEKWLVEIALEHCNIRKYFSHIITCKEVGKGKEFPDVFYKACECLGTDMNDTYVFEDSVTALETAANAGFPVVAVFDRHSFGWDKMKMISVEYIDDGENFTKLIGK